jgi:cyclophilin family peptidyl-prolyl cis-trans isomerase/HEAT repeat protein
VPALRARTPLLRACVLVLAAAAWAGCGAPPPARVVAPVLPTPDTTALSGRVIEPLRGPLFDEIARLEDARDTSGRLQQLLEHADPRVRARACIALGRCPQLAGSPPPTPPIGPLLCARLADSDADVRASAAFALGLRAEPGSGPILASLIPAASDATVRARLVEAASRQGDPLARAAVLAALEDPIPAVRVEAALGIARWKRGEPGGEDAERALISALVASERARAAPSGGGRPGQLPEQLDLEAAALFALSRRADTHGRAAFLAHASSGNPLARIFSIKGLAVLETDAETGAALELALGDLDWRVATEAALALEAHPFPGAQTALLRAVEHSSVHVRRAAALALARNTEQRARSIQGIERALRDVSPAVRAGALVARTRLDAEESRDELPLLQQAARVLAPVHAARDRLHEWRTSRDPEIRVAVVSAAALLEAGDSLPLLEELALDPHPLVAGAAVEELGKLGDPVAQSAVRAALLGRDDGVRLAAVLALEATAGPADVAALEQARARAQGEIAPEVAFNTAKVLGKIGGGEAEAACARLAGHADPWVRHVAIDTLRAHFPGAESRPATVEAVAHAVAQSKVARSASDATAALPPLGWTRNPLVRIDTTRGSLVFELYPGECPVHVHSFLAKARAGFYDDTTFHRVVPDFVVQGGDARGDGNGGSSWRGDSLRNEFTPRKFARGTLGMPRNDNPDSGGSQIFVTHRATPHLDGRYTAFGDLRVGLDVLDRLELGDRILAIVELPNGKPR